MREKLASVKQTIKENKVGIAVIGTVTIMYGAYFGAAYCNLQAAHTQYDTARLWNLEQPEMEV